MKKWLLLAVIGLLAACSQSGVEELNASINGDAPMFYASVEDADAESRTYLDETGKMRWTNDDRITIFFGDNYNREFAFTGKTGALSGGFKQISVDDEFMAGTKMTANYALYPHSSETMLDPSGYFECELPAVQNYAEGSFGLNANTMVSVTKSVDDRFLQFKNVGGFLKLNLYGANVTVKQITLQGNNDEPLVGAAIITPTYGGEPTLTWAASGTTKTLTLDCGSGVKIGQTEEDATAFYLVVPPTTFEKGFAVTITDAEGKVCTKSTSNKQTFTRNVTKNMPAFEAKCKAPNSVPSNQIWYTSTDGNIVEPYDTNAFGVAIKSNTYTDGKGVITFEGDVTTIGERAFYGCRSLASINIPEGVTTIGEAAFCGCTSLASITLPEGVTTIGDEAFWGCTSLASITIPESVTELGAGAFANCSNLQHFEGKYASDNGRCLIKENVLIAFAPVGLISYTIPEGVTTIGKATFYNCTSLASITIPESVTTIGDYAFADCSSLASVTLPEGVTTIGIYAFSDCTNLASITLPEGVTTIGNRAFYYCTSLKSVYCKPTTPPSGGSGMFYNNASGRKIYVPAGSANAYKAAEHWSDYATDIVEEAEPTPAANQIWYTSTDGNIVTPYKTDVFGANIVSNTYENGKGVITFDGELTSIGGYAFYDCTSLASVTLPEGVTTIGYGAFYFCTSLASITLPEGVTTIGECAFLGCTSLASITIPTGVTAIENSTFSGCKNLASINIPEGVTTIGSSAFSGCTSLASITIPKKVTSIGAYAFQSCHIESYTIPDSVTSVGEGAFQSSSYVTSVSFPDGVTVIKSGMFYGCRNLKSVKLGNSVRLIESNAFYQCSSLESISIPKSVQTIEEHAFSECTSLHRVDIPDLAAWWTLDIATTTANPLNNGAKLYVNGAELTHLTTPADITAVDFAKFLGCSSLTHVTISDNVTKIGNRAFEECVNLKSITFPESLTSIGMRAFAYCESLEHATLPNGVTTIGTEAFYRCSNLKSATIPASVTSIGNRAFGYSTGELIINNKMIETDGTSRPQWLEENQLTKLSIGDSVTKIGNHAFKNMYYLTSVTIANSVTSIGSSAFSGCRDLVSVTIPDSVTSIEKYAFYDCTSLASITIPEHVVTIGEFAFNTCTSLASVYCKPTTPPTGYPSMFYDNAVDRKIYVPASSDDSIINAYKAATGWSYYASSIEEYQF